MDWMYVKSKLLGKTAELGLFFVCFLYELMSSQLITKNKTRNKDKIFYGTNLSSVEEESLQITGTKII